MLASGGMVLVKVLVLFKLTESKIKKISRKGSVVRCIIAYKIN